MPVTLIIHASLVPTAVQLLRKTAIWTSLNHSYLGFTRVAVWLGLSGVYGSSDVWVCLVDDSSGVCIEVVWGVCAWVWVGVGVGVGVGGCGCLGEMGKSAVIICIMDFS